MTTKIRLPFSAGHTHTLKSLKISPKSPDGTGDDRLAFLRAQTDVEMAAIEVPPSGPPLNWTAHSDISTVSRFGRRVHTYPFHGDHVLNIVAVGQNAPVGGLDGVFRPAEHRFWSKIPPDSKAG